MRNTLAAVSVGLALAFGPSTAVAQAAADSADQSIKVFLDCDFECDSSFLRLEINYVNWVLDRTDADVHLLVASEETGGGGLTARLRFLGRGRFQGVDDELRHTTNATQTSDERRRGQAQVIRLGLVRYLARTPAGARLTVSMADAAGAAAAGQGLKPNDPWRNWVFTISGNSFLNGESQQRFSNIGANVGINKVLDDWKFNLDVSGDRSSSRFTVPDPNDTTATIELKDRTSYYTFDAFLAKSLGEHWSVGAGLGAVQSTRSNFDLQARFGPALEYNFFKYSQSTQKRLSLLYQLSMVHSDYTEPTIFDRVQEVLVQQSLGIGGRARQPWGDISGSLTATAYTHDFSKNQVTLFGSANLRITKGLDFNLFGSYGRIRDQLSLPAAGASRDEILRQLRELGTSYRYFASVGLSYRFGSIYNNVVNPRFASRGGGGRLIRF